jgi:hypothetical protein
MITITRSPLSVHPVELAVATLKTWRTLFTDCRRPLETFLSSFQAAIGMYFFKETFALASLPRL